uniref:C2H2-type domain-containing protein n=1 Tax=Anopheles dirus TaxID=7168 RepID=A0A182NM80_9DIPT
MAGIFRSTVAARNTALFLTNKTVDITTLRFASANRVKRIKKPEITNRDANQAKSAAMRAEVEAQGTLYEGKRFESVAQSISARGYLRALKPYTPPENASEQVLKLAKENGLNDSKQSFSGTQQKFAFLSACGKAFDHWVPNSMLHELQTIEDAIIFYQTPIDTRLPLDAIRTVELPENLHIQQDYVRFHPETDTMFGGKSAFPKSSTVVTGLKYKQKYRGHEAKNEKLKTLFTFPITTIDSFPSSVCLRCEEQVSVFHTYHELVKTNQEQLWAVQHQKYFEVVKVEPTLHNEYDAFELPIQGAEAGEKTVEPDACKVEIVDVPEDRKEHDAVESEPDEGNGQDDYDPASSEDNTSDDSDYDEEENKSLARVHTVPVQSARPGQKRRGRPRKGEVRETKQSHTSPKRKYKSMDETNQRLREFYDMKCEICDEKLDSFTALKNHYYKQHQVQGYIKCCERTFHSRYRLLEHLSKHVGASMVRCEICDKNFSSRSYLLVHNSRMHGQAEDRPYKCTQCHQSYAMECHLKAHIVSHVRVNCPVCGKELASSLSLRTHMINMHGNRENHICDSCGREFRSRQAFERHVKLHLGLEVTEQVQCNVCAKWLNSKRALKMHTKLVHMEAGQTFQCDLCTQQCPNSRALASHKQRVHVEERFKCEECGKLFKRQLYLKEHVAALHTRKPLYSCEVCGATFNSNANKYSHRKNKHPVEWEARRKQQEEQQQQQQMQQQQQQQQHQQPQEESSG